MSLYKVRNWSQCSGSLKKRGSMSFWISEDAVKKWKSCKKPRHIGAPEQYSDQAILCMMALKVVYHLPYRQLTGFIVSLFAMMKVDLQIPHFTTVAARARALESVLKKLSKRDPTILVFDLSGFKIMGKVNGLLGNMESKEEDGGRSFTLPFALTVMRLWWPR